jgi:hypothetical protein
MDIDELVKSRLPTDEGKVIADDLKKWHTIYAGVGHDDPYKLKEWHTIYTNVTGHAPYRVNTFADPVFGALVYNLTDWILDLDTPDRGHKIKGAFANLTAAVDDIHEHANKEERGKLIIKQDILGTPRYTTIIDKEMADAWRITEGAMCKTIELLHELEKQTDITAAPQAIPDDMESEIPNMKTLVSRMDILLTQNDYAGVLHASASIFETLAKDVIKNPSIEDQTLGSFLTHINKNRTYQYPYLI